MSVAKFFIKFILLLMISIVLGIIGVFIYFSKGLPDVASLKHTPLEAPLLIFSADHKLMAIYGERRRLPVTEQEIPLQIKQAFISIEDRRFYEHYGIDPIGLTRAAGSLLKHGQFLQGGSTITQQLAKNIYLTPEKKITRKIKEAILALSIERYMTKSEILTLYLNHIYFGSRAYGVAAAAYTFFGKQLEDLTLAEMATLAALPKAPSNYNPIYAPERAIQRRNLVLHNMLQQGFINIEQYNESIAQPLEASYHEPKIELSAPHLAEMARRIMYERYGEAVYQDGYRVYTTIDSQQQLIAQQAVLKNIFDYDRRHGYRGIAVKLWASESEHWAFQQIDEYLSKQPQYLGLMPSVVLEVMAQYAVVQLKNGQITRLDLEAVSWARSFINDSKQGLPPTSVEQVLKSGELIWLMERDNQWYLSQIPEINAAFVALSPHNGAITALIGGTDFYLSEFNRVTQSARLVGSSIKPFIYAAALDKGLTLATLLNDAPILRQYHGSDDWRPRNFPERYAGPTRLRVGIGTSKNVMMVRAVRAIGIDYAADFLERFGFPKHKILRTESLVLGAASFTPLQLARGYAVFANDGYLINPFFIQSVARVNSEVVYQAEPEVACEGCGNTSIYQTIIDNHWIENLNNDAVLSYESEPQMVENRPLDGDKERLINDVLDELLLKEPSPEVMPKKIAPKVLSSGVAFLIQDALKGNIWGEQGGAWLGTGWRARTLKRHDLAGKTGTTNDAKDSWYAGFSPNIVAVSWVGFDDYRRELGKSPRNLTKPHLLVDEGGARTAQPAWIDFMAVILKNSAEQSVDIPLEIIQLPIHRDSGLLMNSGSDAKLEYFIKGTEPTKYHVSQADSEISERVQHQLESY